MPRLLSTVSVKTRISVGCTLLFVAIVAALTAAQLVQLRTSMQEVLTAQQFSLVNTVAGNIDDKFDLREQALVRSAQTLREDSLENPAEMQARLGALPALGTLFDRVTLFLPNGDVVATFPYLRELSMGNVADREYLQDTLRTGRPQISAPFLGRFAPLPFVMMTAPVLSADGRVLAVLGGTLNLLQPNFLGKIGATKLGEGGYFSVLTKGSAPIIVAHPLAERIMAQAGSTNPALARALSGFEGSMEGVNRRGQPGLYSFKALEKPGWVLSAMLPTAEAYAPIAAAQRQALLGGFLAAIIFAPLVWLLAWHLLAPLTALRDRIADLRANPDSKDYARTGAHDEIGDLARDFNALMRERQRVEKALRETENWLLTFADNLPVLVSYVDCEQRFRYTNAMQREWFGSKGEELIGRSLRDVFGEKEYAKIAEHVNTVLAGYPVTHEREANFPGGTRFVQATYLPHYGDGEKVPGFYVLVNDISDRKALEARLAHRAEHDTLTGLPNRALFEDRLEQALIRRSRTGNAVALLYLDIDHFKRINDSRGHAAGDELLKTFAVRLQDCIRASDTVARLGGDEFTVLLEGVSLADYASEMAEKILVAARAPVRIGDSIVTMSTSIGIAMAGDSDTSGLQLLKRADAALYDAKAKGRNACHFTEYIEPRRAQAGA